MYVTVERIKTIKNGFFHFGLYFYDDSGERLFGFSGNRIQQNPTTDNLNVFPLAIKLGKAYKQMGFIHFSTWPKIAQAINKAIHDSSGDAHILATAKVRIDL